MAEDHKYPCSGVESVQGRRVTMEDTHVKIDNVQEQFPEFFQTQNNEQLPSGDKAEKSADDSSTTDDSTVPKIEVTQSENNDVNNNDTDNHNLNHSSSATSSSASSNQISYYGVYDGHGGTHAAILTEQLLHKNILSDPVFHEGRIVDAIKNGFVQTDKQILETSVAEGWTSGSTVVLSIISNGRLYTANTGDSEAVLGRRRKPTLATNASVASSTSTTDTTTPATTNDGGESSSESPYEPVVLTFKHKPTEAGEKDRIKKAGGHVVFGRVMGSLAVARSLGDRDYKHPFNKADGDFVSAEPYILEQPIEADDEFLIISCDGLWDKMNYQMAVDFVAKCREEKKSAEETATLLVKCSIERGSLDNVTAIVVFLTKPVEIPPKNDQPQPSALSLNMKALQEELEEEDVDEVDVYEFLTREHERIRKQKEFDKLQQSEAAQKEAAASAVCLSPRDTRKLRKIKLPSDEQILERHECTLTRKVMGQPGTLFVTQHHLIFCSHRMGKKKLLKIADVKWLTLLGSTIQQGIRLYMASGKKYDFVWRDGEENSFGRLEGLKAELDKNGPPPEVNNRSSRANSKQSDTGSTDSTSSVTSDDITPSEESPRRNSAPAANSSNSSASSAPPTENGKKDSPAAAKLAIGNWSRFDD